MLTCLKWRHISLVTFVLCSGCYEPAQVSLPSICHPDEPRCASEDFDGDGVPNGRDDFPLDEIDQENLADYETFGAKIDDPEGYKSQHSSSPAEHQKITNSFM